MMNRYFYNEIKGIVTWFYSLCLLITRASNITGRSIYASTSHNELTDSYRCFALCKKVKTRIIVKHLPVTTEHIWHRLVLLEVC